MFDFTLKQSQPLKFPGKKFVKKSDEFLGHFDETSKMFEIGVKFQFSLYFFIFSWEKLYEPNDKNDKIKNNIEKHRLSWRKENSLWKLFDKKINAKNNNIETELEENQEQKGSR